jgi:hypothetical protein
MYAAEVRIDPADPTVLIVQPRNYQFAEAIHKALGKEFTPLTTKTEEDFLKSLMEAKENP